MLKWSLIGLALFGLVACAKDTPPKDPKEAMMWQQFKAKQGHESLDAEAAKQESRGQ